MSAHTKPTPSAVGYFVDSYGAIYAVENNRRGHLRVRMVCSGDWRREARAAIAQSKGDKS